MDPGDTTKRSVSEDAGREVSFSFEASMARVECGIVVLRNIDVLDIPDDFVINDLNCIYYYAGIIGEFHFTVNEDNDYLIFARNISNITQTFYYEWISQEPFEHVIILFGQGFLIFWPLLLVGIVIIFRRIRAHKHQLTKVELN